MCVSCAVLVALVALNTLSFDACVSEWLHTCDRCVCRSNISNRQSMAKWNEQKMTFDLVDVKTRVNCCFEGTTEAAEDDLWLLNSIA